MSENQNFSPARKSKSGSSTAGATWSGAQRVGVCFGWCGKASA